MPHPFPAADGSSPKSQEFPDVPEMGIDPAKRYTATMDTSMGELVIALDAIGAPKTVNNFVFLAREGFYNGVPFHRIIKEFMVQTGDPTGTGRGGPGYRFQDELNTPFGYEKGTLAMANAGPNTQGSQFFICHGPGAARLPKAYTIFGRVTSGLDDALEKIATVLVRPGAGGENSSPVDPPKIESIEITES
jgi:cyclophilin family peptidyl-prolyl cis-trans isomerase